MNTPHLILSIQRELGGTATPAAAQLALDAVLHALRTALLEDGIVKISRFGTFRRKEVRSRRLRHPHTGEVIQLPARSVIRFIPSPFLTASLSQHRV